MCRTRSREAFEHDSPGTLVFFEELPRAVVGPVVENPDFDVLLEQLLDARPDYVALVVTRDDREHVGRLDTPGRQPSIVDDDGAAESVPRRANLRVAEQPKPLAVVRHPPPRI